MTLPAGLKTGVCAKLPGVVSDYRRHIDTPLICHRQSRDRLVIVMPMPANCLMPNARCHWAAKAKAAKAQRNEGCSQTKAAMRDAGITEPWESATVAPRFYFTTNRRRDRDNYAISLKGFRDSLQDAGLVVNDTCLHNIDPELIYEKGGKERVEIVITRKEVP